MKKLYLMCGISFSGKSTLAHMMSLKTGASIISLDEINNLRGLGKNGDVVGDEDWVKTHEIAHDEMKKAMNGGRDIILDDTNCFRWLRDKYRNIAQSYGYKTVVVFINVDPALAISRLISNEMEKRRNGLPMEYFLAHVAGFEKPDPDEFCLVFESDENPEKWITTYIRDE